MHALPGGKYHLNSSGNRDCAGWFELKLHNPRLELVLLAAFPNAGNGSQGGLPASQREEKHPRKVTVL